jgi:hypothetical protein
VIARLTPYRTPPAAVPWLINEIVTLARARSDWVVRDRDRAAEFFFVDTPTGDGLSVVLGEGLNVMPAIDITGADRGEAEEYDVQLLQVGGPRDSGVVPALFARVVRCGPDAPRRVQRRRGADLKPRVGARAPMRGKRGRARVHNRNGSGRPRRLVAKAHQPSDRGQRLRRLRVPLLARPQLRTRFETAARASGVPAAARMLPRPPCHSTHASGIEICEQFRFRLPVTRMGAAVVGPVGTRRACRRESRARCGSEVDRELVTPASRKGGGRAGGARPAAEPLPAKPWPGRCRGWRGVVGGVLLVVGEPNDLAETSIAGATSWPHRFADRFSERASAPASSSDIARPSERAAEKPVSPSRSCNVANVRS